MPSINDLSHTIHGINNWLALFAGVWTMSVLISGLIRSRNFDSGERLYVTLFAGTLYLQGTLGLLLLIVMDNLAVPPFSGHSVVEWAHIGGGLFAILSVTLALVLSRVWTSPRAMYWAAVIGSGLALLMLGKLYISAALLVFLLLARFAIQKRGKQPLSPVI